LIEEDYKIYRKTNDMEFELYYVKNDPGERNKLDLEQPEKL